MKMDEKEDIKLNLKGTGKDNQFKVPDRYFETFPMRMQERLALESKKGWSYSFAWQRPQLALVYVFAALIMAFASVWFFRVNINEPGLPMMSSDEIAQLIDNDIMGYDEYMIIDEFIESEAEFSSVELNSDVYDLSMDDIDLYTIVNEL